MSAPKLAQVRELYADGLTLREACTRVGVSYHYTHKLLRLTGWTARKPGWNHRLPEATRDEIERLVSRNMTVAEVAKRTGASQDAIHRLIRERKIERQVVGRTTAPMRRVFLYGRDDQPRERWCAPCSTYKPMAEFGANRGRKHGVGNECRACCRERGQARKQAQASS